MQIRKQVKINSPYLFTSERLGFRNWTEKDLPFLTRMNSDPRVMRYFPGLYIKEDNQRFIRKMNAQYKTRAYCYFAVELLEKQELIGFNGICFQDYEAPFTPATDIGWRIIPDYWGKGYATEGAKRVLEEAFKNYGLDEVYSVAPHANVPSISVMKKIGMSYMDQFDHDRLPPESGLNPCNIYRISATEFTTE